MAKIICAISILLTTCPQFGSARLPTPGGVGKVAAPRKDETATTAPTTNDPLTSPTGGTGARSGADQGSGFVAGACGGRLPPCYVLERESRGSLTVINPASGASGKWQFIKSTWNWFGGYENAADAPESVQDAKAAEVWNGGAGCSAWSAC